MSKNETALDWIKRNHPEIYAMYVEYLGEKRRKRARDYQRNLQKLAKQNAKPQT